MYNINYKTYSPVLPGLHHRPSETIIGSNLQFQIQHHTEKKKKKITRNLVKNNVQKCLISVLFSGTVYVDVSAKKAKNKNTCGGQKKQLLMEKLQFLRLIH